MERLFSLRDLAGAGLHKATSALWRRRFDFPEPIKMRGRQLAWREADIGRWLTTWQQHLNSVRLILSDDGAVARFMERQADHAVGHSMRASHLYAEYVAWFRATFGDNMPAATSTMFGRRLSDLGFRKIKASVVIYRDVVVRAPEVGNSPPRAAAACGAAKPSRNSPKRSRHGRVQGRQSA